MIRLEGGRNGVWGGYSCSIPHEEMPSMLKMCKVLLIAGPCTFVSSPGHLLWRVGID